MTVVRDALHRWALGAYVVIMLTAAALRHIRRAQRRRRTWAKVEAWW